MVCLQFDSIGEKAQEDIPDFSFQVVQKLIEQGSSVGSIVTCTGEKSIEPIFWLLLLHPIYFERGLSNIWRYHGGLYDVYQSLYERPNLPDLILIEQFLLLRRPHGTELKGRYDVWKRALLYLCRKGATLSDDHCNQLMIKMLMVPAGEESLNSALNLLTETGVIKPESIQYHLLFRAVLERPFSRLARPGVRQRLLTYTRAAIEELGASVVPRSVWHLIPAIREPDNLGKVFSQVSPLQVLARHRIRKSLLSTEDRAQMNINTLIDSIPSDRCPSKLKRCLKLEKFQGVLNEESSG